MSNIIKLDRSASSRTIQKIIEARNAHLSGSLPQLQYADSSIGGLRYGSIPEIGSARSVASSCAVKLDSFFRAFDAYINSIDEFDYNASNRIKLAGASAQTITTGSGWTANKSILDSRIREKLLADGFSSEQIEAFFTAYGSSLQGLSKSSAYVGDPINMSTGNFVYKKEDITIKGSYPLSFSRFYNAVDKNQTTMGPSWTHSFNIWLKDEGESVQIAFEDGHHEYYQKNPAGGYTAPAGRFSTLQKCEDAFLLTTKDLTKYNFTADGKIVSILDSNNNATNFIYNNGYLTKVFNSSGTLEFAYTENGLLCEVRDHTNRTCRYEYRNDLLIRATQANGAVYQYKYNSDGKIRQIINPAGVTAITNEYDAFYRTTVQRMADGGRLSMEYEEERMATVATEQNGNQVTYFRDQRGRTVKIAHSDGEEKYEYDQQNNRTKFTDKRGNTFRYSYDENGNLVKAVDALKNVTSFAYNEFAKPLQVNNPDGSVVKFSYDENGNLLTRQDPLERVWQFSYSGKGLPHQQILPDGSSREYTYDERGNITSIIDSAGSAVRYEYNALNQVVKFTNAEGHSTCFEYNEKGDIKKSTNALGYICEFEYNTSGNLISAVDYCGNETRFSYNKIGKVERVIDALGNSSKYSYDLMGNLIAYFDQEGNVTRYKYDTNNRLIGVTDPEGGTISFEHDPNGNITAVVGATGERTTIEYDALNRAVRQVEPDGLVMIYEYDSFGRLTTTGYPNGKKETREYDKAGQLVARTNLCGETVRYQYTLLGQLEKTISQNNDEVKYEYYPGGRLKRVIKPEGETESYIWDNNGNIVQRIDALGNSTKLSYDALDRVVEVCDPHGGKKKFSYDAMGRVVAISDINGNTTQYRYTALGALLEVIDASGHSTQYTYNAANRLTSMEQARIIDPDYGDIMQAEQQRTTYEYNRCGKLTGINAPLGSAVRYSYDAGGRMVEKQDGDAGKTFYQYNQIGQLVETAYADGRQVFYKYGELRQLAEVQDWLGVTKFERNSSGQVNKITRPDGSVMGYEWSELGQRKKTIYPDGSEVEYAYNASGRLTQVNAPNGITQYTYDAAGRILQCKMPEDIITNYNWDSIGRLTQLVHQNKNDVLDSICYQYDPAGNIKQIEKVRAGIAQDNGLFEYAYDSMNRLIRASHNENTREYAYDSLGNRIFLKDGERHIRYSYNALNQLIGQQEGALLKEYSYDTRGNLAQVVQNGKLDTQYCYDSANMLVQAVSAQNGVAEYCYDGLKNRVSKNTWQQNPEEALQKSAQGPEEAIHYFVDIVKPFDNLVSMQTNEAHTQNFIWGKGLLASTGDSAYTYLQDHLGSPVRLIEDGEHATPLAFDEFGVPLVTEKRRMHNPFGFTGYQNDEISGLYYAQARYYDPVASRMAAADTWGGNPVMPQTINHYAYCLNNPLTFVDKNGKWPIDPLSWLLGKAVEAVGSAGANMFADFMDSIPDDILEFAKENLTPGIAGLNEKLESIDDNIKLRFQEIIRKASYNLGEILGHENLAKWGANALDMHEDENQKGVYYADFDCWQRRFGYNDIYDQVFEFGTSMDKAKFEFSCGGEEFIFWAWRGDYLNLGAGAELGIYRQSEQYDNHWEVDQSLAMPMTLRLKDIHGNTIFGRYPEDPQWWITGFNSNELLVDASETIAIYTIGMWDEKEMFVKFYGKYFNEWTEKTRDSRLIINPFTQMVTFTFMPEGMENTCIS